MHALSSVETSPDTRKSQSFVDFDENYDLFLSRLRHFDVYTIFSLHYACRTHCTRYPASKQAKTYANHNHSSILKQIKLYYSPVWDISTSKRYFHCIMRAERSARFLQRRNNLRHTQIATSGRFWRKLCVISLQLKIFRCLYAVFTALCVPNLVNAFSSVETSRDTRK